MDFEIKNINKSITSAARELGYLIIDTKPNGEYNMVRKLAYGSNYPRFHIYARTNGERIVFSLHLDQKKPSYEGSHAHSGEYFGPLIDEEADRIKNILCQ